MTERDFGAPRDPRFGDKGESMFLDMMRETRLKAAKEAIKPEELFPEKPLEEGETLVLVARNAKDARPKDIEGYGSLNTEWADEAKQSFLGGLSEGKIKTFFTDVINDYTSKLENKIPEVGELEPIAAIQMFINTLRDYYELFVAIEKEIENNPELTNEQKVEKKEAALKSVKILVVASDVILITPKGKTSDHMRGMETGQVKIDAIKRVLEVVGAEQGQLLNSSKEFVGDEGPYPYSVLKDLRMFEQTPKAMEFANWLTAECEKRGINFWAAYEVDFDWVKEKRKELGIEGPEEIATRIKYAVSVFSDVAKEMHKNTPESRVVIDMTTAYDTISPYAKSIMGLQKEDDLLVKYGAGVAVKIDRENRASTRILGDDYIVGLDRVSGRAES